MARPREANPRDQRITLRLTADELLKAHTRARKSGLTVADFARSRMLKPTRPSKAASGRPPAIDPELWIQVRKLGVNLNQIAHRLNAMEEPELPPDLDPLLREIRALLAHPIAAYGP